MMPCRKEVGLGRVSLSVEITASIPSTSQRLGDGSGVHECLEAWHRFNDPVCLTVPHSFEWLLICMPRWYLDRMLAYEGSCYQVVFDARGLRALRQDQSHQ